NVPRASISMMVSNEYLTRQTVLKKVRTIPIGVYFITNALTTAASRIPVPVADSRFSEYTAASGCGADTTGGTLRIALCSPAMGNAGANRLLSHALTGGRPQINTNTDKITQGVQAAISAARGCCTVSSTGLASA